MSTSHFKVSRHKVVEVPNKYVVSEDEKLSSQVLTQEEISILKHICTNPIFKKKKSFVVEKPKPLKSLLINICSHYNITENDFLSHKREVVVVKAKKEFCHHAKKINKASVTQIAKMMNKDYSTVCWYLKQPSPETDKLLQSFNDNGEE
jgi:chromosomal replication initiation ATPase DnaA